MKTTRRLAVVAAVLSLALTGCGSAPSTSDSAGAGSIKVTDMNGTQSLPAVAKRVVALEWSYGEDLLALGVQPVGVADIKGYDKWVTAGSRFASSTKDVGKRQEPSLDAIYQLKPDLIVTDADRVTPNSLAALKKIAPTLVFDAYVKPDHLSGALNSFRQVATAVGRSSQAQAVVGQLDSAFAEGKTRLAAKKKAGTKIAVVQAFTTKGSPQMRMFTPNSIPGQIAGRLGLVDSWPGKDEGSGFTTVGVEGLTQAGTADLVYVAVKDDNPFATALPSNAVYAKLPAVVQKRVYALDPGTWFFGGPLSAKQAIAEFLRLYQA